MYKQVADIAKRQGCSASRMAFITGAPSQFRMASVRNNAKTMKLDDNKTRVHQTEKYAHAFYNSCQDTLTTLLRAAHWPASLLRILVQGGRTASPSLCVCRRSVVGGGRPGPLFFALVLQARSTRQSQARVGTYPCASRALARLSPPHNGGGQRKDTRAVA